MDRGIEGAKEKKIGWSNNEAKSVQNITKSGQKSTSGTSKWVQNEHLGEQLGTRGVVLEANGAQGRPRSPPGGAPGAPRMRKSGFWEPKGMPKG